MSTNSYPNIGEAQYKWWWQPKYDKSQSNGYTKHLHIVRWPRFLHFICNIKYLYYGHKIDLALISGTGYFFPPCPFPVAVDFLFSKQSAPSRAFDKFRALFSQKYNLLYGCSITRITLAVALLPYSFHLNLLQIIQK